MSVSRQPFFIFNKVIIGELKKYYYLCNSFIGSGGGIGRHAGLKIPWAEMPVRVRFPSRAPMRPAEIAQLVEHNLAKVGVASSSLVFRSSKKPQSFLRLFLFICTNIYWPCLKSNIRLNNSGKYFWVYLYPGYLIDSI